MTASQSIREIIISRCCAGAHASSLGAAVVTSASKLRICAGYMFVAGIAGLVWPFLGIGKYNSEFKSQTLAFRAGAITRVMVFAILFIVSGVGLFWHEAWARWLALGLFVVSTHYTAQAFAGGYSMGYPTRRVRLISHLVVATWNGFWFYLIYRSAL